MATTERGLDRLIFFTDAVAAIAITLLILPLVDMVPEAAEKGQTVGEFLGDNSQQLLGFVISFVVIARLWRVHHSIFEHVPRYNKTLITLTLAWSFTIVVLPLPTALISELHVDRLSIAIYIGTMLVSSLVLSSISLVLRRNPSLEIATDQLQQKSLVGNYLTSILFAAALVLGVVFPVINFWAILLVTLAGPLDRFTTRGRPTRTAGETGS